MQANGLCYAAANVNRSAWQSLPLTSLPTHVTPAANYDKIPPADECAVHFLTTCACELVLEAKWELRRSFWPGKLETENTGIHNSDVSEAPRLCGIRSAHRGGTLRSICPPCHPRHSSPPWSAVRPSLRPSVRPHVSCRSSFSVSNGFKPSLKVLTHPSPRGLCILSCALWKVWTFCFPPPAKYADVFSTVE